MAGSCLLSTGFFSSLAPPPPLSAFATAESGVALSIKAAAAGGFSAATFADSPALFE